MVIRQRVDGTGRYFVLGLYDRGNLEPRVKQVTLLTLHYVYRTSILSFGGCLQEPKPILRYVLDKCLNV